MKQDSEVNYDMPTRRKIRKIGNISINIQHCVEQYTLKILNKGEYTIVKDYNTKMLSYKDISIIAIQTC